MGHWPFHGALSYPVSQQACTSILVDWITEMVVGECLSIIQPRQLGALLEWQRKPASGEERARLSR